MTGRPNNDQKCSSCGHPFAQHYTTYDGQGSGCGYRAREQRDNDCLTCQGFTMIYREPMTSPVSHVR